MKVSSSSSSAALPSRAALRSRGVAARGACAPQRSVGGLCSVAPTVTPMNVSSVDVALEAREQATERARERNVARDQAAAREREVAAQEREVSMPAGAYRSSVTAGGKRAPSPLERQSRTAGLSALNASGSWYEDSSTMSGAVLRRRSAGPRLRPVTVTGQRRTLNAPPAPGRTRRYYFPGVSPSPNLQSEVARHAARVEARHFDVKLAATPTTEGSDGAFEDHMEFRYVDFLATSAPTLTDIGVLTKEGEADVSEIAHFLNAANPRTRLDAYPMWILGKEIIRLLLQMRVGMRDREMEAQHRLMDEAQGRMTAMHDQLMAAEKTNAGLRGQLSEDDQKLLEEEDKLKQQQMELFALHVEIEQERKEMTLRKSQTDVEAHLLLDQSKRIEDLEAERQRLEAAESDTHDLQLAAQNALSKQLQLSEQNRQELEEAMASEVLQAEMRRKLKPVLFGFTMPEKAYALAALLDEQDLVAVPGATDIADPELEEDPFGEDAPAINGSDPAINGSEPAINGTDPNQKKGVNDLSGYQGGRICDRKPQGLSEEELLDEMDEMTSAHTLLNERLNEQAAELERSREELAAAQAAVAAAQAGAGGASNPFSGGGEYTAPSTVNKMVHFMRNAKGQHTSTELERLKAELAAAQAEAAKASSGAYTGGSFTAHDFSGKDEELIVTVDGQEQTVALTTNIADDTDAVAALSTLTGVEVSLEHGNVAITSSTTGSTSTVAVDTGLSGRNAAALFGTGSAVAGSDENTGVQGIAAAWTSVIAKGAAGAAAGAAEAGAAELERLKAELAAAQVEAAKVSGTDAAKAAAAAWTTVIAKADAAAAKADAAAAKAAAAFLHKGADEPADSGTTVHRDDGVPWTMVITEECKGLELRADPNKPGESFTQFPQGETLRVYEETTDGKGVQWVRTPHGWIRRDAGCDSVQLYGMLQKQRAETNGAGGSGSAGADGTNGVDGPADGADGAGGSGGAGGGGVSDSAGGTDGRDSVKGSVSRKVRDARAEKLLQSYAVGGKSTCRPMPTTNIVRLVDKIYAAKVGADETDDKKNHRRESFPLFIQLFLTQEFGLKSIADKNLKALVAGVHKFSRQEEVALGKVSEHERARIQVFGELAGMGHSEYSWVVVDCMMDLIRQLYGNTKAIQKMLNREESLIHYDHVLRSVYDIFGLYGFQLPEDVADQLGRLQHKVEVWFCHTFPPLHCPSVLSPVLLQFPLFPSTFCSWGAMGQVVVGRKLKQNFIDPVLEMVLLWARDAMILKERKLTQAFAMFDKDGNGCLDTEEFGKLIAHVSGKEDEFLGNGRSERDILQMYTEAIEVRPSDLAI